MDWDAVDPLFEGPPEAFVAARNALAKELRAGGDREAAAEVAKLRRPTATAHALNQVARHRPEVVAQALDARAALRAATEDAGRGGGADLREATAADRTATRAVVAAAREVLGREDAGLAQRITGTLLAAVLDDAVGAALRAGRLTAEQDASALAFATEGDLAPVVSLADHAAERTARRAGGADAPRASGDRAAKAAAKAAEQAERARRREQAEREQAVDRLERRVRRLDGKVAEAEDALAAAREERDAAHDQLAAARAALEDGSA